MDFERTSVIKHYPELHKLYRDNIELLKPYHLIDNVLFTHAGINQKWINSVNEIYYPDSNKFQLDKTNVLDWIGNEWLNELKRDTAIRDFGYYVLQSPIFWCSWSRGGIDPAPGVFWRDHYYDDSPIKDFYTQIYGHTRTEEVGMLRKSYTGWCLDSRAIFELDLDTKELKFSDINEDKVRESITHRYCERI